MYNFNFSIPTEIFFGKDCWKQAGVLMKKHAERVLMVYGSERIFREGLGEQLVECLQKAGCAVIPCGGVKPNADADYIRGAIKIVREQGLDGIIAVGGGSVIDSAKAISAGSGYDGDIMELYRRPPSEADDDLNFLPIGAIVTIPATASESNEMSVISDGKTGRKYAHPFKKSKPFFAMLDPALTLSVSSYQTACGGFDVFSHAFERFFDMNRKSTLLDSMTSALMKEVAEVLPKVIKNPGDEALRGEMMLAATVAHNDMLGPGGDFACHEMSHVITEVTGIAHGGALAMIVPAWCEYVSGVNPKRFRQFFEEVFSVKGGSDEEVTEKGIKTLRAFIAGLGLAQTIEIKSEKADYLSELAEETLAGRETVGWGFASLGAKDIEEIYKKFIKVVA